MNIVHSLGKTILLSNIQLEKHTMNKELPLFHQLLLILLGLMKGQIGAHSKFKVINVIIVAGNTL